MLFFNKGYLFTSEEIGSTFCYSFTKAICSPQRRLDQLFAILLQRLSVHLRGDWINFLLFFYKGYLFTSEEIGSAFCYSFTKAICSPQRRLDQLFAILLQRLSVHLRGDWINFLLFFYKGYLFTSEEIGSTFCYSFTKAICSPQRRLDQLFAILLQRLSVHLRGDWINFLLFFYKGYLFTSEEIGSTFCYSFTKAICSPQRRLDQLFAILLQRRQLPTSGTSCLPSSTPSS